MVKYVSLFSYKHRFSIYNVTRKLRSLQYHKQSFRRKLVFLIIVSFYVKQNEYA